MKFLLLYLRIPQLFHKQTQCNFRTQSLKRVRQYLDSDTSNHYLKETSLNDYIQDPSSGNHRETYVYKNQRVTPDKLSLWDEHDHSTGHFWNLSIDLTKCIGCAACVISCQAENNVAVVGKEEVRKNRDMHWLRIDRYFSSEMTKEIEKKDKISTIKMFKEM